jgi:lia operon protein LiaF
MQASIWHRLFWGIVLVAVGAVFLLDQTGTLTVDIGWIFGHLWPVFMILFGLQGLLIQRSGGYLWNVIVIAVGFVFLGRNLEWFTWDLGDIFRLMGPVILILFGIGMIFRGGNKRSERENRKDFGWNPITPPPVPPPFPQDTPPPFPQDGPMAPPPPVPHDVPPVPPAYGSGQVPPVYPPIFQDVRKERWQRKMERREQRWQRRHGHHHHPHDHGHWNYDPNAAQHHRFIGDVHIGQDYWELRPMNISHFIGDTTLDLTKAQIPVGDTKIYVSCFIGDVKVFVPNDLSVGVQVVSSSLIGDVRVWDHKRGGFFNHMSVETPSYADTDKRVILIASSFIGDVRVTKVG